MKTSLSVTMSHTTASTQSGTDDLPLVSVFLYVGLSRTVTPTHDSPCQSVTISDLGICLGRVCDFVVYNLSENACRALPTAIAGDMYAT